MLKLLKMTVLLSLALIVSVVVGIQMLSHGEHIPEGSKLFALATYVGTAILGLGILASLYLIPKANRNIGSFLKAYVIIGMLASFGGCSSWLEKFHGEKKQLTNDSGLSVTAPSDWTVRPAPSSTDLFVMNWGNSNSVGVTKTDITLASPDEAQVAEVLSRVLQQTSFENPMSSFRCGNLCLGKQFKIDSKGTPMRVLFAVKYQSPHWLVLNGVVVESESERNVPIALEIMEAAR